MTYDDDVSDARSKGITVQQLKANRRNESDAWSGFVDRNRSKQQNMAPAQFRALYEKERANTR